jgi:hypothetical protein
MDGSQKLTIIIPTYNSARMRHLAGLVRSVSKCTFVEKIILSNNNPALAVHDHVRVRDPRLMLLETPERPRCTPRRGGPTWRPLHSVPGS